MTKIAIILGTARQSAGTNIFDYLRKITRNNPGSEFEFLNLRDFDLPFYDHKETPLSETLTGKNEEETRWLDALKSADGYIMMTPEYDHAFTGILKNALDLVGPEVRRKPVQILAYTSYSDGGILAAQSLVQVLQMLKMIVLPNPLLISAVNDNFGPEGNFLPDAPSAEYFTERFENVLTEIIFYAKILKDNPYPISAEY